jgi:hypothetical protein
MNVLNVTNMTEQLTNVVAQQMAESMRRSNPDMPARVAGIITEVVVSRFKAAMNEQGGLISQMVPIYAKYFTREDVQALTAFYQSEAGRKSISVMPALFQESMMLGQRWTEGMMLSLRAEVEKRLREEGIR